MRGVGEKEGEGKRGTGKRTTDFMLTGLLKGITDCETV